MRAAGGSRPKPPFPKQSQPRPGIEAKMRPRPAFMAPDYHGAGRLDGKVALITGGCWAAPPPPVRHGAGHRQRCVQIVASNAFAFS